MHVHSFVQRQIECPICMDTFDTPRVLPCLHTFCQKCLQRLLKRSTVRCPECREIYRVQNGDVSSFPRNRTIEQLLDGAQNYADFKLRNAPTHQSNKAPNKVINQPLYPTAPPLENQESQSTTAAVPETNDQTNGSTPASTANATRESCCQDNCSCCINARTRLWRVLKIAVKNKRLIRFFRVFAFIYCLITLSRGIAGFVKLNSDCKQEHDVAIFLIVKACLAAFYWVTFFVLSCVKHLRKAINNPFILICLTLDALFGVPWLCLGTYWIFGKREEISAVCPLVEDWNSSFLDFSSFLIVLDWICFTGFLFFAAYTACAPETDYDGLDDEDESVEHGSRGDTLPGGHRYI